MPDKLQDGELPGPVDVEQVDEQALAPDVLLSIPKYLHKSIFRAFARHRLAERERLINTPETAAFMAGVPLEAAHQRERWGAEHDAGKTPFDWFWLVGYLAQKAVSSAVAGDAEKAMHHTISTAAALANWHAHLNGMTDMRPGIGPQNGGEKAGSAFDLASRLDSEPASAIRRSPQ